MSKYVKEEDKGFIDKTADEVRELAKGDAFCILPWIHMHPWPQGKVFPCCLSNTTADDVVGDVNVQTIDEVYNGQQLKRMRRDFLANKKHHSCTKCYDQEALGRIDSLRMKSNEEFVLQPDNWHKFENKIDLVKSTQKTGRVDEVNMAYLDIRFSNICNMRCRMCGPDLSSLWYHDAVDSIYNVTPKQAIYQIAKGSKDFLSQFDQYLHTVEKIYWAGGEPLIMDEHWYVMNKLVELGRTDVQVHYNTNLSKLKYKDNDAIELWKNFKNINIGASLDDSHQRAEYIRKGTVWSEIEDNMRRIRDELPSLDFYVSATADFFNTHSIVDFYNYLLKEKFIDVKDFQVNILFGKPIYRATCHKPKYRNESLQRIKELIKFLEKEDKLGRALNGFIQLQNFLEREDKSYMLPDTMKEIKEMDTFRKEDFFSVFPEYADYSGLYKEVDITEEFQRQDG